MRRRGFLAAVPGILAASRIGCRQNPSLASLASRRGILFGTAVTETAFANEPVYADLVRTQAAAVTPETSLKWGPLRPSPDRYDFARADALLAACEAAGLRMRGHNLVWHVGLPGWLSAAPPGDLGALLAVHIGTVCGRYRGRLYAWDVVNEPIRLEDGRADGLRDTPFMRGIGPDYIETALRLAARADPHATLVINEMDVECEGAYFERRRATLLALVRRLRVAGAPLHAVGIESHLKWALGCFDPQRFASFLRELASLGVAIHLTEFDVADLRLPADAGARDVAIAELAAQYLAVALAEPAVKVLSVWELTDRFSWLSDSIWTRRADGRRSRGCLYDDALQPKPVRVAVAEELARVRA